MLKSTLYSLNIFVTYPCFYNYRQKKNHVYQIIDIYGLFDELFNESENEIFLIIVILWNIYLCQLNLIVYELLA